MKKSRVQEAQPSEQTTVVVDPLFTALADALHRFSLSLVKIVSGYVSHPTATSGATPKTLLEINMRASKFAECVACCGVAANPDGNIWISCRDRVQTFSAEGKFLHSVAVGQFRDAMGIAFAANGDAYIADYLAHTIVVCRADGSFVRKIGGAEEHSFGPGPAYVAIERKRNLLFVTESFSKCVRVLLDGNEVGTFGGDGDDSGEGQFTQPWGLALNTNGEIAVGDFGGNDIKVFDLDGNFLRKFGDRGLAHGQFQQPYGLATDAANNWLVADMRNRRVQVFTAEGVFITAFKTCKTTLPPDRLPRCVCVDAEGRILVGDGSNRVKVFAFGCR